MKLKRTIVKPDLSVLDHPELFCTSTDQVQGVLPVLRDLLSNQKSKVADLLFGRPNEIWTQPEMRTLEDSIVDGLEDPKLAFGCLRLLHKAVTAWVLRTQLEVPFPRTYSLPKYSANPLPGNLKRVLDTYDAWKELIEKQLEQYRCKLTITAPRNRHAAPSWEIVIASAIVYGGIHDLRTLLGIVRSLPEVVTSSAVSERRIHVGVWVDRAGVYQFRAWHPDALTATLLFRCDLSSVRNLITLETASEDNDVPDHALMSRFKKQFHAWIKAACGDDKPKFYRLGGLRNLLRVTQKVAYIELPVIVAAYASGAVRSQSLGFDVLKRISKRGWAGSEQSALQRVERSEGPLVTPEELTSVADLTEEVASLREALSGDSRMRLRTKLQNLKRNSSATAIQNSMADFALSLICVPTKNGRREPAAVRETVLAVASALHSVIGAADPLTMQAKELDPLIKEAVARRKTIQSLPEFASTIRAFVLFNTFLVARGIEDEDRSSVLIPSGQLGRVDPNVVSFEEYRAILQEIRLRWPVTQPLSRQQLASVLVILGFRCGLRREEARKLKINDALLGGIPELLIRCSKGRTLKSDNASRRALLDIFLESEELRLVEQWWQERIGKQHQPDEFLFGGETEDLEVVPAAIFDTINEIIHRVTGDPSVTFHHLRHSFATWGFLRLMNSVVRPLSSLLFAPAETAAWLEDGETFRPERLYRHKHPTRKHAYLLAQFMGHGSPATSLASYIHCLDWLLAAALAHSERMSPNETTIEMASGLNKKTYARWVKNSDHWVVPLEFRRQRAGGFDRSLITERSPASEIPAALNLNELERTWNFLMTIRKAGETSESASTAWGIDTRLAETILERVSILRQTKGVTGWNLKRPSTASDLESEPISSKEIPNFPRHKADQQVLAALASYMQSMQADRFRRDLLAAFLGTYARRVWQSRGYVLFHDPKLDGDAAREFMAFLDSLPPPCSRAGLISFDLGERSIVRADWRMVLQISKIRKIRKTAPPNSGSGAPKNWLAVVPEFRFDNDVLSAGPGQAGFRFAMSMGSLRYGNL